MTNLHDIAKEIAGRPEVVSASVWKDRRVYVNLVGFNSSFAGDRNHKVFYDIKTGWNDEGHKGTKSRDYSESYGKFYDAYLA